MKCWNINQKYFPTIINNAIDVDKFLFNEDVRKLEGALNELLFKAILYNPSIIDEEFAMEAFKNNPQIQSNDEITPSKIKKVVCNYYNITKKQIEKYWGNYRNQRSITSHGKKAALHYDAII